MKQIPGRNWHWILNVLEKWETANPNGQPRKGISLVNHELSEAWYKPASKQDIEVNYMSLLQLEEEKLKEFAIDKTKPMLIRILAKNMLDKKGFNIIEKMLDRWIWKSVQKVQSDVNITNRDITEEEKQGIENILKNNWYES